MPNTRSEPRFSQIEKADWAFITNFARLFFQVRREGKLNIEMVLAIRKAYDDGDNVISIAKRYGINASTVCKLGKRIRSEAPHAARRYWRSNVARLTR